MKLRLLAGTINDHADADGWHNVTLDANPRTVWDHALNMGVAPDFVAPLQELRSVVGFRDGMFDEVRLHHVLEHVPVGDAPAVLAELHRIIRPGGVLDIEVPNLDRIVGAYARKEISLAEASQWLLGEQLADHSIYDCHRSVWTDWALGEALRAAGFDVPARLDAGYAVRFQAVKPAEEEA